MVDQGQARVWALQERVWGIQCASASL